MAAVALITASTSHATATNTRDALRTLGHTVTLVADSVVGSTSFSGYDLVVTVRSAASPTTLRSLLDGGMPMILSLIQSGTAASTGQPSQPTSLRLTGTVRLIADATANTEILVTDDSHPIMSAFGNGRLVVTAASNWAGGLDSGASHVGDVVASGDPDTVLSGRPSAIAIEAGTLDLDGVAVGARVVAAGFVYAGQSDYSHGGKVLLGRLVSWVLNDGDLAGVESYSEDFEGFAVDAVPSDFGFSHPIWSVQDHLSSKRLRFSGPGTSAALYTGIVNPVGFPSEPWFIADIASPAPGSSGTTAFGIGICAGGTDGYWLLVNATADNVTWRLFRGIPYSTATFIASFTSPNSIYTNPHRVELRRVAATNRIQARIYLPGGTRPTGWDIDVVDTTYTHGRVGFLQRDFVAHTRYYDNLAITTDGSDPLAPANTPPVVAITAPADGATYEPGETASFVATATDAEDGDLTASIAWTSDVDGALGIGGSVDIATLSLGTHVITASATDSASAIGTDTVTITIAHVAARITSPDDGDTLAEGDAVNLSGEGLDAAGNSYTGADLVWSSSLNGALGTGGSLLLTNLSAGSHTITLTTPGGTDSITLTITAAPPFAGTVTITDPAAGASVDYGDPILFAGSATDGSGTPITGSDLVWTSNIHDDDAPIGTGESFSYSGLLPGTHVIKLTATAADATFGSAQITVTVAAAPVEPVPIPEGILLWDTARPRVTSLDESAWGAEASLPGVAIVGGIHDPALYATTDVGPAIGLRASADVIISGRNRWSGIAYYYGQFSVRAGVGVAGYGFGNVGESPTWFGFMATIRCSPAQHSSGSHVKGYGPGVLEVTFLDPTLSPSDKGYAGRRIASLAIPKLSAWSDLAHGDYLRGAFVFPPARWWTNGPTTDVCPFCGASTAPPGWPNGNWTNIELEVTQESAGVVRVKARINGADGVNVPLPTLDGWHINKAWGNTGAATHTAGASDVPPINLDCALAGYAGKSIYDIESFRDGYMIGRNLNVEVVDAGTCTTALPPGSLTAAVEVECDTALITAPVGASADLVRYQITTAADTGFATPIFDSGWISPTFDPQAPNTAYLLHEGMIAGDYLAMVESDTDGITVSSSPVPFTIEVNTAPTAPTWIQATATTLEIGAATDAESDPLVYEVDVSYDDGQVWQEAVALGGITPATPLAWDSGAGGSMVLRTRAWDGCLYGPYAYICVEVPTVTCPPEAIQVTTIRRLEIWSDIRDNGGQRIGFIPDFLTVQDTRELGGEESVTVTVPRDSSLNEQAGAWSMLVPHVVIRTVYRNLTWEEWRLSRVQDGRTEDGAVTAELQCDAIAYDLRRVMMKRTEANGLVQMQYGDYGRTPIEHLTAIVAQAPAYFHVGIVEPTAVVDMDYNWDTPRSALEKLVAACTGYELEINRSCNGYLVHILAEAPYLPAGSYP